MPAGETQNDDARDADAKIDELARAARAGEAGAFDKLVHRCAARLYRFLTARGAEQHTAEDLVQETLVKAYLNLQRYDPQRRFLAWLFTIAARTAASHYRSARRHESLPDDVAETPAGADDSGDAAEGVWDTARALLTPIQFDVLWLKYGEGLTVREIAGVTGKTTVYVKVLLHRARRRLAEHLRPTGSAR